ncbi:MAG: hypothetical protein ACN6OP_23565 [Pseudomonadales bacterium]|uniref:hypothetical protein n=1 Tax=Pseudomonas protegens TaxID=380021 RepID=UPI001372AA4A|nr:hypothetical protein [Pseudomonas protegens]NAN50857.1 hypothetical protein [Pseudomonas protegens]NUE77368.1 hypothetical protein [Pseudomonas protegens]
MFNMATMAADECREDAQERHWHRWQAQAAKILGRDLVYGSDDDMLHDLYCDGCTPAEAVTELLAQMELDRVA